MRFQEQRLIQATPVIFYMQRAELPGMVSGDPASKLTNSTAQCMQNKSSWAFTLNHGNAYKAIMISRM
jgi:hypothetical protein